MKCLRENGLVLNFEHITWLDTFCPIGMLQNDMLRQKRAFVDLASFEQQTDGRFILILNIISFAL